MIRLATQEDWSLIVAWRDAHFAEMQARMSVPRGITGQKEFDEAVWLVNEHARMPVAALSFTQDDENQVRWIHDLYAAEGHAVAGYKLSTWFEVYCDGDGYEIRGCTDPENEKYLEIVRMRGYEITSIHFWRRPRYTASEEPLREERLHEVEV